MNDEIAFANKCFCKISELDVLFVDLLVFSQFLHLDGHTRASINVLYQTITDHDCHFEFEDFLGID